jgi:dTDP-4-dehydrorhamnose reductase
MVITGAGGQVGRLLAVEAARNSFQVCAFGHRDFDIADPEAARRQIRGGDLVVNCAAFTDVDASEAHPDSAHSVNAAGPANLAQACAQAGARLIHISTDYVFGGDVAGGDARRPYEIDDPCAPVNVYGRTKLEGELAVHAALPSAHVVRTSWVFTGGAGSDFVAVMRRLAATDRTIDVVCDQTGSPTYAADLVDALLQIGTGTIDAPILHAANAGMASRFEQARAVFAALGADPERVRPVGTDAMPRPARRPVFSALSMAGSVRAGLQPLRPWPDAVRAALAVPIADPAITSTP